MKVARSLPVVLLGITGMLACREPRAAVPEGALARYQLAGTPTWRVTLPAPLHEISGLAVSGDGRVFAHGDEDATVHQIDPRSGEVGKRFSLAPTGDEPDLGKKPAKDRVAGDFEDLAIVGDRFFLVASNGVLLEFAEGQDGVKVPYTAHPTSLGEICEVEGLTHDEPGSALLQLCKTMRSKAERDRVTVYAWPLDAGTLVAAPRLILPWTSLEPATGARAFNGSALEFTPGGRSLAVLAGPQRLFAEVTNEGVVVGGGALLREAHPQPESIAFLPDGTLLIASEGGKGDATLSGYAPR